MSFLVVKSKTCHFFEIFVKFFEKKSKNSCHKIRPFLIQIQPYGCDCILGSRQGGRIWAQFCLFFWEPGKARLSQVILHAAVPRSGWATGKTQFAKNLLHFWYQKKFQAQRDTNIHQIDLEKVHFLFEKKDFSEIDFQPYGRTVIFEFSETLCPRNPLVARVQSLCLYKMGGSIPHPKIPL